MDCGFYIQAQSKVNGRGVWYYLIASPIGNFHIIEYETKDMSLKRFVYDDEDGLEKASRKYRSVIRKLASES